MISPTVFLSSAVAQISKIRMLNWVTTSLLIMLYMYINADTIFTVYAGLYRDVILTYIIMVVLTTKDSVISSDSIFKNILPNIIFTVFAFFFVSMIPVSTVSTTNIPQFRSLFYAPLFYIFVIGFAETIVFAKYLSEKYGVVFSSVLFGLFHIGSYTAIALSKGTSAEFSVLLPLLMSAVLANFVFTYILQATKNIYLTSLIHGVYDMARFGFLTMVMV